MGCCLPSRIISTPCLSKMHLVCRHIAGVRHMATLAGLLRAKGVVWVAERRRQRFVLHLSGRQRAECSAEAAWDSQPLTQLVR